MSPRKRQMRVEATSVVLPDAASHTTIGKMHTMHAASSTPFRLNVPSPAPSAKLLLMKGTWNSASSTKALIQNAPRTLPVGLKTRESNTPVVNGQSSQKGEQACGKSAYDKRIHDVADILEEK